MGRTSTWTRGEKKKHISFAPGVNNDDEDEEDGEDEEEGADEDDGESEKEFLTILFSLHIYRQCSCLKMESVLVQNTTADQDEIWI